jgi:ABC-type sugar transport system permease subunit
MSLSSNKRHLNKKNKCWVLLIPFSVVTLILVIIPLVLIIVKSFIPVDGASVKDN